MGDVGAARSQFFYKKNPADIGNGSQGVIFYSTDGSVCLP
jgi:hypothetical protein